jgi:aspartyl protease family protein
MIGRGILICSLTIVVAVNVPRMFGSQGKPTELGQPIAASANLTSVTGENILSYTLRANDQGHFAGRFRINGKPMDALIDTGATFVTMSETTARNLGYGGNELSFRHEVATANGKVKAARIRLKSIEIGTVAVRDVDAMVIRGKVLETPLIGMSYLRKLSSYRADDGKLELIR